MKVSQVVNTKEVDGFIFTQFTGKELVGSKWLPKIFALFSELDAQGAEFTKQTSKNIPIVYTGPDEKGWMKDHLKYKADNVFFLILKDDTLIGAIDSYTFKMGKGTVAIIPSFIIDASYRGLGLGSALLKTALSYYRNKTDSIMLDTYSLNNQAIKLYSHLGFVPFSTTMVLK